MPRKKKQPNPEVPAPDAVPKPYDNSAEEQQKIVGFIDKLIKQNVKIENEKNKERTSDYGNLVAMNSEWLDTFLLMGYNLNGEEVIITKARNTKEYNAVLLLLKKAFVNLFMKAEG